MQNNNALSAVPEISTRDVVNGILSITENVPVPMVKVVSKAAKKVLDVFGTKDDPLDQVLSKLNQISSQINNLFSVVKQATDYSLMESAMEHLQADYKLIRTNIELRDTDFGRLENYLDSAFIYFSEVSGKLGTICGEYAGAMKTTEINLSDYLYRYNMLAERELAATTIALECCSILREYLGQSKAGKKALAYEKCLKLAAEIEELSKGFISGSFEEKVPKWLHSAEWKDGIKLQNQKDQNRYFCYARKENEDFIFAEKLTWESGKYSKPEFTFRLELLEDENVNPENWKWRVNLKSKSLAVCPVYYVKTEFVDIHVKTVYVERVVMLSSPYNKFMDFDTKWTCPEFTITKLIDDRIAFEFLDRNGKKSALDRSKDKLQISAFENTEEDEQWIIQQA